MSDVAQRLRSARQQAGFETAAAAAQRFGWKTPTYTAHENASRGIKPTTLREYAAAFRVDAAWLQFGQRSQSRDRIEEPQAPAHGGFAEPMVSPLSPSAHRDGVKLSEAARQLAPNARTPGFYRLGRDRADLLMKRHDILIIDMKPSIRSGDVILADIVDTEIGAAETVLAIYAPPLLISPNGDPTETIIFDRDTMSIMGRVEASFRTNPTSSS